MLVRNGALVPDVTMYAETKLFITVSLSMDVVLIGGNDASHAMNAAT